MDKMGILEIVIGIILVCLGLFGAYYFINELIFVLKGVIGVALILVGILLLVIGYITVKE
jgi:hypothetical protein